MSVVTVMINGREVSADTSATVLDAARRCGIYVPALCSYGGLQPMPEVVPDMACQLCVVDIDGALKLSCATRVADGMKVRTETPQVKRLRRRQLTEIMRRFPPDAWNGGGREMSEAIAHIGTNQLPAYTPRKLAVREDSPVFIRDHNLCINCERCVRVCDDIRGARAIEFAYPCHRACPAGIDIPRYIRLIGRGRPSASLAVIRERVPFPGVLGRVCIHPCESACQRGKAVDTTLQIRMLKRFAADNADESWKKQAKKLPATGKRVAVVGSGPAGLTVAYYLAKQGHGATVFEALSRPGGMMLAGIPEYRLPRNVLDSEIREIVDAGVEIRLNSRVKSLDSLFDQGYDAVFVGVGAHQGMRLGVPGEELSGVVEAVEFLRRGNLGERVKVGDRVGVVGGGNVAVDAARMAARFGARKVTVFYRRSREEMPASAEEVEAALDESVEIVFLAAPVKVMRESGHLKFTCLRMRLGEADGSGRARPVPIEGSEFVTELDTLLVAIGQRPEVPAELGVAVDRGNVIKVNSDMSTSRKGVFSGGDCVSGPASVIGAIAAGRKAAEAIDRYLGGTGDITERLVPAEEAAAWLERKTPAEKLAPISCLSIDSRINGFEEVEKAWDWNTARAEAQRCLRCYVITPPGDKVLQDANCQFCGACVDSCPTGALVERSAYRVGSAERTVTTICPYCGVGCQLKVEVKNEKILRVVPDPEGPANRGQSCVKGKFGLDFIFDPARLKVPLVRKYGKLVETTWDEALATVAARLKGYAADEVAVVSSAKCTNEENYLIQKFARAVLGTNNIDHCARLCHAPSVAGLAQSFGSGAMTNSIAELGDAACILVVGSNTTSAHPVIGVEVIKAIRKGAKLIVADPRQTCLVRHAEIWLRHRPGTDVALLMGMARVILDEGLADTAFIEQRCENFDAFKDSLTEFDLDFVARVTGVPAAKIAEAARIYATRRPAAHIYSMGITQHTHGTDNVIAAANLAMLTGNLGRPSCGVNPLRGQNNVQGACDMGALPNVFPGYQGVGNDQVRQKFETAWRGPLPSAPGLTLTEMIDGVHRRHVKAMYLVGENPALAEADGRHVLEGLKRLDFLVVQDIFLSETAEYAHVVLPASSFAEKDGTFTNTERRVQQVRKIFEPPGEARPDWLIICEVARRMGSRGFDFDSPGHVLEEVSRLTPSYGGITCARLELGGLCWPCPTEEHPGTPILHTKQFTRGKGQFLPLKYRPSSELPDSDYPLVLTTGRSLFHFHTGTMTRKVKGLTCLMSEEQVEMNPADAAVLGIASGDVVRVSSRRADVTAKAKVTENSPQGVIFMTFHFAESPTNQLTNPATDPVARIPEFKVCAVRVEKVSTPVAGGEQATPARR